MQKPYVICHMGTTIDGRIISEHWGEEAEKFGKLYEQCHDSFDSQAWIVGRVTMEKDFTEGRQPIFEEVENAIIRQPFVGDTTATSFAIAVDENGKLGWHSNNIDGDHVIEILSEAVSDGYLAYLQRVGVSYLFAGKDKINLAYAIQQLHEVFGIKTLMLEGGGHVNGSFLQQGLIDEVSVLVLPLADGNAGTPTLFEVIDRDQMKAHPLKLKEVKKLEQDVVWLKYKVAN